MRLTIPWAALVSSRERNKRRGGKGHSWAYKRSVEGTYFVARSQVQASDIMHGPARITLDFHPPDRRRRDVTNYCKALLDALQGACYADDYQLVDIRIRRMDPDRKEPRVEITIQEAP